MQNVQFLNILPGIGVGVSAPGAQLAQDSQTGVSRTCLGRSRVRRTPIRKTGAFSTRIFGTGCARLGVK